MTRQTTSILLLFFFSLHFIISAQIVSSIEIEGTKNITENQYLSWIKIQPGTKLYDGIKDSISNRIIAGLKDEGYFNLIINKIDFIQLDTSECKATVSISEGEPTKINSINFVSYTSDSNIISTILQPLKGEIFSRLKINEAFSSLLDYYENDGFPFSKIKIESVYFFNDTTTGGHLADLYLAVERGEKSSIDLVEIDGNTKTKDYVIIRAVGISSGEKYEQKKIDEIPDRLNRLRFFDPVQPPEYYFDSQSRGVLKITIKEKVTNNFDGIFGYVPAVNENEKGFFTGSINISLINLFGTGRAAAIRWLQENPNSQELELHYLEPWLFGFPFNIEAGLFQRKQDSTYVQRSFEGRLEYLATQDISASLIINSQSTIPSERVNKTFTVFNSSAFTSGLNLKIDTRDDFYAPKDGMLVINTYKFTSKNIDGPNEFITPETKVKTSFQRLELDFSIFKEFFVDQVAALGVHARELRGSDAEVSDLYYLGGTRTLRGYRERQFEGNRILWSNLEYRYLLTRRSFAFLFFDTGYFLRNGDVSKNIPENSDFKIGYGFGLNIETGLGVLGISFALGKGDSFSEGKIHFGIINEF